MKIIKSALPRSICFVLCAMFVFALSSCGNSNYNYNDSTDLQTEKELVALLREYDDAYSQYNGREYVLEEYASVKIEFVFEETTVFTSDNFLSMSLSGDTLSVKLDAVAAEVWAGLSSENIGATVSIIQRENDNIEILSQPIIESPTFNGIVYINNGESLYSDFLAIFVNARLTQISNTYNAKRSVYQISAAYLPNSLSTPPVYINVAPFIARAELKGF